MADGFSPGASFSPLRDGGFKPRPSRTAAVTVRHARGGDVAYVDNGGRTPGEWRGVVRLANLAALDALAARLGEVGTLTLDGSAYTAILMDLSEIKVFPTGGEVLALVQFVTGV